MDLKSPDGNSTLERILLASTSLFVRLSLDSVFLV